MRSLPRILMLLGWCVIASVEAAPHRLRVHPNPSITILGIAEGPDEFLWLAAEDGLYRFDGFRYHKIPDYPLASARFVGLTADGTLWIGGSEGLVRFSEHFELILREAVDGMAVVPDAVFVKAGGIQRVDLDGQALPTRLAHAPQRDLTAGHDGLLSFVSSSRVFTVDTASLQRRQEYQLPDLHGFYQVVPLPSGSVWLANDTHAVLRDKSGEQRSLQRRASQKTRRSGPLVPRRGGGVWFVGETILGTNPELAFRDRQSHNERFYPTAGWEAADGRFWVASLGQGLVEWTQDVNWRRWFPEDFGGEPIAMAVRASDGTAVVGTRAGLYRFDDAAGNWRLLGERSHEFAGLLPEDDGRFLASIRRQGVVRLSAAGLIEEILPHPFMLNDQFRRIVRASDGRVWVGSKLGLTRLAGPEGSQRLEVELLPGDQKTTWPKLNNTQAIDFEVDSEGRLWVGYQGGLAFLEDDGRWRKLPTDVELSAVRSFTPPDPDSGDIWVAYRPGGAFARLRKNGDLWRVLRFEARDGYGPVDSHFIKRDSRGWIWRGSTEGVHISDGVHVDPNDWIHIQMNNGLAANHTDQYGFFEDSDGSVWISGFEGVTHLRPDPSWFAAPEKAPPPRVTRLVADGKEFLGPESIPSSLPATRGTLRIDVGSLHSPPFRDYPLRYRLLPYDTDWRLSRNGELEFRGIEEGHHTLEVGYTGVGPSAISTHSFWIGERPRGVSRLWFWLLPTATAVLLLAVIVHRSPRFEAVRYRIQKAIFVAKRRSGRATGIAPSAPPDITDYSGETLAGRYEMMKIVSGGSFSTVYEASDLNRGGVRVAVKVLRSQCGQDRWLRDRFAHEIAALSSIDHPGVVRILDSWVSAEGEPFLVMPFLEGPTLRASLRDQPLPPNRVAGLADKLGAALAEVHRRGIIHRDLKPENVILAQAATPREQPVLIDFGMAAIRGPDRRLADTTLLGGSLPYMAPERLVGRYAPATDIYSLGVIVLEMLTGKRLNDLGAMAADDKFLEVLAAALSPFVGQPELVARQLAPAYDSEPRRRPADVAGWAAGIAQSLETA